MALVIGVDGDEWAEGTEYLLLVLSHLEFLGVITPGVGVGGVDGAEGIENILVFRGTLLLLLQLLAVVRSALGGV
jgi:hypothetical protein